MKLTLTFEGRGARLTASAENEEEKMMLGCIGAAGNFDTAINAMQAGHVSHGKIEYMSITIRSKPAKPPEE